MRTTLTLDDDLALELKREARRTGRPLKRVVNDALRAGITAKKERPSRRYVVKAVSLGGVVPGVNLDKALALPDALEDEGIARKLEQRK